MQLRILVVSIGALYYYTVNSISDCSAKQILFLQWRNIPSDGQDGNRGRQRHNACSFFFIILLINIRKR